MKIILGNLKYYYLTVKKIIIKGKKHILEKFNSI